MILSMHERIRIDSTRGLARISTVRMPTLSWCQLIKRFVCQLYLPFEYESIEDLNSFETR
ncbi:MAG: hypothetical protein J07HX5_01239 [halophilic archaeon J07HX5]|nr:MAG: hypothetical protein J07HX5_01239 [halophilic archaeon J07HX5]